MRSSLATPPRTDVLIAGAFAAVGVVEAFAADTTLTPLAHGLVTGSVMVSLAWRRSNPLAVLVIALVGLIVVDAAGTSVLFGAVMIAAYTTGAVLDGRAALAALGVAVLPVWGAMVVNGAEPSDLVGAVLLYGGSWAVGRFVRRREGMVVELEERVHRLDVEQRERYAAAVAEERASIARELHDIVSHSISVIALQSQAIGRRLGPDRAWEREQLREIETTARNAMGEMRRLFGVLRSDGEPAPLAPQPGLEQLPKLLQRTRDAGLAVELHVEGDARRLPPGVDLAAYRIVQEGLTNALKHARAGVAIVRLRYDGSGLDVVVDDDGRSGAATDGDGGQGLIGMRERVALYGGSLDAGPRADGGFRVHATLPYREESAS